MQKIIIPSTSSYRAAFDSFEVHHSAVAQLQSHERESIRADVFLALMVMGYTTEQIEQCAFDQGTILDITAYIDAKLSPRVHRWHRTELEVTHVIDADGKPTKLKGHRELLAHAISAAGVLLAYCMCNVLGGSLQIDEDKDLVFVPDDKRLLTAYPISRVYKYMRHGSKYVLSTYIDSISATAADFELAKGLLQVMVQDYERMGGVVPEGCRWQRHMTPEGKLERVVLVDSFGTAIVESTVQCSIAVH